MSHPRQTQADFDAKMCVRYVYYETTEQHETTDEQLRLHATMCFDGDCPECAK
jgi:hypothetical protein